MLSNPTAGRRLTGRTMVLAAIAVALPLTATRAIHYVDVPTAPKAEAVAPLAAVQASQATPGVAPAAPAQPAAAQTVTTGILGGTVEDQQGGRLPGVTVVAVHTTTGTTYQAVTQSDGRFSILNLRVGTYSVKANLSGFKESELKDIVVSLGEERTLIFKLELASVSAEITVTAEATPKRRARLTESGAVAYLTKPVDLSELFAALEVALAPRA